MRKLIILTMMAISVVLALGADAKENVGMQLDWRVKNVKICVAGPVVIHCGSSRNEVKVTLPNRTQADRLRVAQNSSDLEIGAKPGVNSTPQVEKVEIWLESLRQLAVYGASDVDLGNLDVSALNISHSGSGKLKIGVIDCTTFNLEIFGSVDTDIRKIDSTSTQLSLAGRGNLKLGNADTTTFTATLSGIGDMDLGYIDATAVSVNVSGNGHVKVRGDASTARLYSSSFGSIDATGLKATRVIDTDLDRVGSTSKTDKSMRTLDKRLPTTPRTPTKRGGQLLTP